MDICCVSPLSIRSRANVLQERRVRVLALLMNATRCPFGSGERNFALAVRVWASVSYRICYYFFPSSSFLLWTHMRLRDTYRKIGVDRTAVRKTIQSEKGKKVHELLYNCSLYSLGLYLPSRTGKTQPKYSTFRWCSEVCDTFNGLFAFCTANVRLHLHLIFISVSCAPFTYWRRNTLSDLIQSNCNFSITR